MIGISGVIIWLIGILGISTKPPGPPRGFSYSLKCRVGHPSSKAFCYSGADKGPMRTAPPHQAPMTLNRKTYMIHDSSFHFLFHHSHRNPNLILILPQYVHGTGFPSIVSASEGGVWARTLSLLLLLVRAHVNPISYPKSLETDAAAIANVRSSDHDSYRCSMSCSHTLFTVSRLQAQNRIGKAKSCGTDL